VWWPWWFLLLLLWRNLQFLLFTLPVCVKKTPGVGGTLLQTNDRHTSQGGIIASRSLSLSLLFLPPDPTSSPLLLDRNCWLLGVSYALEWFYNKWRVFASCQKKKKMRTSLHRRCIINYTFMDR
jgi:hypothetical protein